MKPKICILTGSGISEESGISTFRDSGGLWEKYDVTTIASIKGWHQNRDLMIQFYNERRKQLATVTPNYGHIGLAELQKYFEVFIITQNVDDLHERAGSKNILHLHGELTKIRDSKDPSIIKDIGYSDMLEGNWRPHVVWFGEGVPEFDNALKLIYDTDILAIIGTSLQVYPAANLVNYIQTDIPLYIIDPDNIELQKIDGFSHDLNKVKIIKEKASKGVKILIDQLLSEMK